MNWKDEWKTLAIIAAVFFAAFFLPVGSPRFDAAVNESLHLAKWYAREHVVFCLIPAFFIAGAIGVFISQAAVMKYLGPKANKALAFGVAAVSGTILAVCSCTVLPLFAGIKKRGAGLGPACAFLYSGPAINVLAIALTARILGLELGIARAVGAIIFSVIIGLLMHLFFRKSEEENEDAALIASETDVDRPLWKNALYFASMVGILVFANWGKPQDIEITRHDGIVVRGAVENEKNDALTLKIEASADPSIAIGSSHKILKSDIKSSTIPDSVWKSIHSLKWIITAAFAIAFGVILIAWFNLAWHKVLITAIPTALLAVLVPSQPMLAFAAGFLGLSYFTSTRDDELGDWFSQSWEFAKQILPLLLFGVLIAGALLGQPGSEGLIPSRWISESVGGNGWGANIFASVAGAFMYFATLTEVPILQGLIGSGMRSEERRVGKACRSTW